MRSIETVESSPQVTTLVHEIPRAMLFRERGVTKQLLKKKMALPNIH